MTNFNDTCTHEGQVPGKVDLGRTLEESCCLGLKSTPTDFRPKPHSENIPAVPYVARWPQKNAKQVSSVSHGPLRGETRSLVVRVPLLGTLSIPQKTGPQKGTPILSLFCEIPLGLFCMPLRARTAAPTPRWFRIQGLGFRVWGEGGGGESRI